jgi:hypothetical protein
MLACAAASRAVWTCPAAVSAARSPWRAGELLDEIVGMLSQRVGEHQR